MKRSLIKSALRLVSLFVTFVVALGAFGVIKEQGWLSPFGIESESSDSQVIQAIERTEEVSLVQLSVQGIKDKAESATIFGTSVPWSEETVFLQYTFEAKLGLDDAEVEVTETGENSYLISVPEFTFIGYDEPTFEVAATDGGALSWATPDVDQVEMVNEILDDEAKEQYLADNEELLRQQTEFFYDGLIASVAPEAVTEYEFRS